MHNKIIRSFLITFLFSYVVGFGILYGVLYQVSLSEQTKSQLKDIEMIQAVSQDDFSDIGNYLKQDWERLTIIKTDGTVIYDNLKSEIKENHLQREEVKEALKNGKASSIRHSETMGYDLLYTAIFDSKENVVFRLATKFEGISQSAIILVPAFFVSFIVAILIVWILSKQMTKSIMGPLQKISDVIRHSNVGHDEIIFDDYDYPELKEITQSLDSMNRQIGENLAQLEKEKVVRQEFFTNASHELKTPLTSIRGYSELLRSQTITDPDQVNQCLDCVLKESDHMTRLVNDILTISKLETNQAMANPSYIDIQKLLDNVIDGVQMMAQSMNVTIQLLCPKIIVYANKGYMETILKNLLTNAIKYNKPNGKVDIRLTQQKTWLYVTVQDTGIGISKEDQERIFQRFYRVDKQRSKTIPGTGLGLAIVKHIVQFYQGNIQVTSQEGLGTTMTLSLPIAIQEVPTNDEII